jgi:glyoxylase-like metal-dependent hydrolase (beta-lactamase superfamily II)
MGSPSAGVANLHAEVFIGAFLPFQQWEGTFAATTSTLISGASETVLIDAQHIRSDVAALGDLIERTGRRLTTIYATHGHADHWYGAGELVARFPGAQVVATPPVLINAMSAGYIRPNPRHREGRQVVFYAGDDVGACAEFDKLIDRLGFAPVQVGGLRDGGKLMQLEGPLSLLHVLKQD